MGVETGGHLTYFCGNGGIKKRTLIGALGISILALSRAAATFAIFSGSSDCPFFGHFIAFAWIA